MTADDTAERSPEERRAAFQAAWDARLIPFLSTDWQSTQIIAEAMGEKPSKVLERLKDMLARDLVERRIVKVPPPPPLKPRKKRTKRPRVHTARLDAQFRLPANP